MIDVQLNRNVLTEISNNFEETEWSFSSITYME